MASYALLTAPADPPWFLSVADAGPWRLDLKPSAATGLASFIGGASGLRGLLHAQSPAIELGDGDDLATLLPTTTTPARWLLSVESTGPEAPWLAALGPRATSMSEQVSVTWLGGRALHLGYASSMRGAADLRETTAFRELREARLRAALGALLDALEVRLRFAVEALEGGTWPNEELYDVHVDTPGWRATALQNDLVLEIADDVEPARAFLRAVGALPPGPRQRQHLVEGDVQALRDALGLLCFPIHDAHVELAAPPDASVFAALEGLEPDDYARLSRPVSVIGVKSRPLIAEAALCRGRGSTRMELLIRGGIDDRQLRGLCRATGRSWEYVDDV